MNRVPDFYFVGPPRTATTWLHGVLAGKVGLPRGKETWFFDYRYDKGLAWYLDHFNHCSADLPIGEIAPTYFCSELARQRMLDLSPAAKIVCIFRDPIPRLFSLWKMKRAYGKLRWSFEEAVNRDPEMIESSRYAFYLKAWQHDFGKARVLATLFDDLVGDPQTYLDRITGFIGIPSIPLEPSESGFRFASEDLRMPRSILMTRIVVQVKERLLSGFSEASAPHPVRIRVGKAVLGKGRRFPPLDVSVAESLRRQLLPEIEALEDILNIDLAAWKPH